MSSQRSTAPIPRRSTTANTEPYDKEKEFSHASTVYREVWAEFYEWKEEYIAQTMQSLRLPPHSISGNVRKFESEDWTDDPVGYGSDKSSDEVIDIGTLGFLNFGDSRSYTTVTEYQPVESGTDEEGEEIIEVASYKTPMKSAFASPADGIDPTFEPHPRYFSCTSTSTNIHHNLPGLCHFSPYEDDVHFNLPEYLDLFQGFSWQVDFIDPDVELIQLEAVRRLHFIRGLSLKQIDDLKMFVPTRLTRSSGLIWNCSQRDTLDWPGKHKYDIPELTIKYLDTMPPDWDVFEHVKDVMKTFCPNLNCLQPFCPSHRHITYPELEPKKPKFTSQSLLLKKGNPCGQFCYRYVDPTDNHQMEGVHWVDEDNVKTLHGILKIEPDALPCDLAKLVHAKCQDVFIYRCRFFSDDNINVNLTRESQRSFIPRRYNDEPSFDGSTSIHAAANFAPLPPCHHKGPCDRDSGCQCFLQAHHCQRNCICDKKCAIRWKGCRCKLEEGGVKRLCSTDTCECRAMARECDPEMCTGCNARGTPHITAGQKGKRRCYNVDTQIAKYPLIEVRRGTWGLGSFTTQALKASQAIGEYTGEIFLHDPIMSSRTGYVSAYTGLNYKFDLNKSIILDSMYSGNEMRYLNHFGPTEPEEYSQTLEADKSQKERANCIGKVIYVNNEHRIAFFTERRIKAGEELFIDYGANYWLKDEEDAGNGKIIYWR